MLKHTFFTEVLLSNPYRLRLIVDYVQIYLERRSPMNSIVKIGMDVHSTNYTLCAMEPVLDGEDRIFANIQVTPDYKR